MTYNIALKMAILQRKKKQKEIAARAQIADSTLSRILHGYRAPTERERKALARVLRQPESALFPSEEAMAS